MVRPSVLLVTEFPDERLIYGDSLRAQGYDVRIAAGPDDGVREAVSNRPTSSSPASCNQGTRKTVSTYFAS